MDWTDCSEQQKMQQTEDSTAAKISPESGQYESINLSVPDVVYAKVNPAQKSEPEYDEVPWNNMINDHVRIYILRTSLLMQWRTLVQNTL